MIASVDSAALLELAWAAPIAALVVVIAWGVVVYGTARAGEARRDSRTAAAVMHVAMAVLGLAVFVAAIVFGLVVITAKS
jgi:heme/copper-type cytochrome/quinol oxidase subunit 2